MKMTSISFFSIAGALLLSGCTDQQAREYATQINTILQRYEKQIQTNIEAEQKSYEALAAVYETEKRRNALEPLVTERAMRSAALTSSLVEGSASASGVTQELEDYVSADFDRT